MRKKLLQSKLPVLGAQERASVVLYLLVLGHGSSLSANAGEGLLRSFLSDHQSRGGKVSLLTAALVHRACRYCSNGRQQWRTTEGSTLQRYSSRRSICKRSEGTCWLCHVFIFWYSYRDYKKTPHLEIKFPLLIFCLYLEKGMNHWMNIRIVSENKQQRVFPPVTFSVMLRLILLNPDLHE